MRGVEAGIVSGKDNQTSGKASVGGGKERVRCHVETHVLHGDKGLCTGKSSAAGDLHGDLLVHRILQGVAVTVSAYAAEGVRHLRGGCAGITGDYMDTGLQRTTHYGFIAQQEVAFVALSLKQWIAHLFFS